MSTHLQSTLEPSGFSNHLGILVILVLEVMWGGVWGGVGGVG